MGLSTVIKPEAAAAKGAAVIGDNMAAVQAAFSLARMGIDVKLITSSAALCGDSAIGKVSPGSSPDRRYLWPLLLQVARHPGITVYTNAEVDDIKGVKGDYTLSVLKLPRYINEELCTACGCCEAECSVKLTSLLDDQKLTHGAIHALLQGDKSVPSAYLIDKNGASPCVVACPLGINVQGFISLLSKEKTDKALALISEAAPLAGILGRVCTHPCEDKCNLSQIDSPVSVRALHRYAADTAPGGINYISKSPAMSRQGKIAIIGSGPAGLTAAWELTRRGYSPTVFESHGVIGGMLATGIPRFRLPREVREREIEAIRKLGVDVRTGITFGRDINFAYLKERGYQAVFLAIGAQRNNSLNIPGEEIDGVVDCMSLLLALNLKLDTFVGSNVAVIGGGNAAIDAARSTLRSGAKEVTVFYRRTRAEMPANSEEVEEAINEGVKIEYNVVPMEILGEKGKVTALHLQRTKSNEETATGGQSLDMVPDTDFLVYADHVVVAIGQSPDATQLNMRGLNFDENTGVIQVNQLTLETSVPGVFAGGDCITGPNNVVEAMAAGLRAAESIDRFLRGRDLEAERTLEPPPTAGIDPDNIEVSPYRRAMIPFIRPQKRIKTYEETTLGISPDTAYRETRRCLNCALCSQCLECTTACKLGAVCHDDTERHLDIEAEAILRFVPDNSGKTGPSDIQTVVTDSSATLTDEISRAMAAALETAIGLKRGKATGSLFDNVKPEENAVQPSQAKVPPTTSESVGVFLCSCGGSISSVIDFKSVYRKLSAVPEVTFIGEIAQACTEKGARQISGQAVERNLDRMVLAACRCCNLEQVCYSCTDRRQMCQQQLDNCLIMPHTTAVEFCNIREQCAWIHEDDPRGATSKAIQIISAGVARARLMQHTALEEEPILPRILVIGGGLTTATAARALTSLSYTVEILSRQGLQQYSSDSEAAIQKSLERFEKNDLIIKKWPNSIKLHGSPGNYDVVLGYGSRSLHVNAGAVLVDIEEFFKEGPRAPDTSDVNGLFNRIVSRDKNLSGSPSISDTLVREVTIGETSGIFTVSPGHAASPDDLVLLGFATAARISAYMEQKNLAPRASAVSIDSARCRGCGECAGICPYIDMRQHQNGAVCAYINKNLCLGCGACITTCPTGAITQADQSDRQIIATISSMLLT